MAKNEKSLFIILGNQLFPLDNLKAYKKNLFFMAEDYDLCTYQKHHKHKIILFLASMRRYASELKQKGFEIDYIELDKKSKSYEDKLQTKVKGINKLISFEIEDKFFEKRIEKFCKKNQLEWKILPSPMFTSSRENFKSYLKSNKKPFMKTFYEKQRKDLGILVNKKLEPEGGKWSFDDENRSKPPKDLKTNKYLDFDTNLKEVKDVKELVSRFFKDHPGDVDLFWCATSRKDYLKALDHFLKYNLENFGKYQDAITNKDPFLFHSILSPGINLGLISPKEVVDKTLEFYKKNKSPLNSVEGFIRQIIGWREFVRGIYQNYSEKQDTTNFWKHKRKMKSHWYEGKTGIPPLDDAIQKAIKYGYNHHIERLMILSNIMLLCEIEPREVHDWFMMMYVDSSDWVMGPNVYGMGQFSDGGIFATKPYVSGSNYILKMSDYKKGEWCDIWDGLYWRFIDKQRDFFLKNYRMSMMVKSFDKMNLERKKMILKKAEDFLKQVTT